MRHRFSILTPVLSSFCLTATVQLSLEIQAAEPPAEIQAAEPPAQRVMSQPLPLGFRESTELLLTPYQVGPISHATSFDIDTIQALFPDEYEVIEETAYAEGEPYPRMRVQLGDETLMTFDNHVDSVTVSSPQVANELGPRVGTIFSAIYPTVESLEELDCFLGEELSTGYVRCTAPNAENVHYYFTGPVWGRGYAMPAIEALREWRLANIRVTLLQQEL